MKECTHPPEVVFWTGTLYWCNRCGAVASQTGELVLLTKPSVLPKESTLWLRTELAIQQFPPPKEKKSQFTWEDVEALSSFEGKGVDILYDNILMITDKAVLFEGDGDERWVPKSVIISCTETEVEVTPWFADKAGL